MSRNLRLVSDDGGFMLIQTPTTITNEAMKLYDTGCSGSVAAEQAVKVYTRFLKETGVDVEEVDSTINKINAFLAFAPNARFTGW